jgi:hypothetical protein
MAARAGADGRLSRSLRLGASRRLSGRWRGVLESLVGRARVHGRSSGLDARKEGVGGARMTLQKQAVGG